MRFDSVHPAESAITYLRDFCPKDKYYGCFSGGKDSVVIKRLAEIAEVPIEWHYNVTTIDPPELIYFMKRHHPDVVWERPKHGPFFQRMEKKGFPTRRCRWCCEEYKESVAPRGSHMVLGVRAAESSARAKRWGPATVHRRTNAIAVSPIVYWEDVDVWDFIREEKLPYCRLYDEGFDRLGCIGCPMARESGRKKEFARWPGYERLWMRSFMRIWERRTGTTQRDGRIWFGDAYFTRWEEMWDWWLEDRALPKKDDGQIMLEFSEHATGCQGHLDAWA